MTQIIGAVYKQHAFLVSDRLLTTQARVGGLIKAFDEKANKTVIYRARDGIVAIGYTGRGYLEGLPADHWMASILIGLSSSDLCMYSRRPDIQWLDCGLAVNTLELRLNEVFKRMPRKDRRMAHEVCVVGWRWRRNRKLIRPFVCELIKPMGEFQKFRKTYSVRFWNWNKTCHWVVNPDRVDGVRKKLPDIIVKAGGLDSPEKFEQGIVKFIRHLSEADKRVGKACMAVRINPWAAQELSVRYEAYNAVNGIARMIDSFTPIVIAPPSVWGASEASGGRWSHEELVGGKQAFRWTFQGVDLIKKPTKGFRGTQSRPEDPQTR